VGNWEAGTRENIRGEALFALASALGVTPSDLLAQPNSTDTPPDELQLVAAYRQLSPERRRIALTLVRALKSAP
jgi:transcriptional regulator with XRE-family HTH domain